MRLLNAENTWKTVSSAVQMLLLVMSRSAVVQADKVQFLCCRGSVYYCTGNTAVTLALS